MKIFNLTILWLAWSLAVGLWVADPFLSMRYYEVTQRLKFYPTNADSIGIPIFGAFFIAIIGLPVWLFSCRKAFRQLSVPWKPFDWGWTKLLSDIAITFAFGFCIYWNIQSAKHYDYLFHKMQESNYSHLTELATYLKISSFGWAILWVILCSCLFGKINAGEEVEVPIRPKISWIMILCWIGTFFLAVAGGSVLWKRTIVRSQDELEALSKENQVVGTWQIDVTRFHSKDYNLESFRDFRVIMDSSGDFAAVGVPRGIFFNKKGNNSAFKGTWKLSYYNEYHINFIVNDVHGPGASSIGIPIRWENGHAVFDVGENSDSINLIRVSSSTGGKQ